MTNDLVTLATLDVIVQQAIEKTHGEIADLRLQVAGLTDLVTHLSERIENLEDVIDAQEEDMDE